MTNDTDIYHLSEGNPGALSVLMQLDFNHLVALNRTDLRGSMIWVAYKDICAEDITTLRREIEAGTIEDKVKATPEWEYYSENL